MYLAQCLKHGRHWVPITNGYMIRINRLQLLELRIQNSFMVVKGSILDPDSLPQSAFTLRHTLLHANS